MPRITARLPIPFSLPSREGKLGQSLVEFALVLPILTLLIVGTLDLGRAYFAYMSITNAAREGARYAAAHPPRTTAYRSQIITHAKNEVDPNLVDVSQLTVNISCAASCGRADTAIITVTYPFRLLTGVIFGGGTITLSAKDEMEIFSG